MKKIIIILLAVVVASSCANEPKYKITGTIQGGTDEIVVLQKRISGGFEVLDSVALSDGTFKLEGAIDYPQMVTLAVRGKRGGRSFFLENSEITINGHLDSLYTASVSGSKAQAQYDAYMGTLEETNSEMTKIYDRYRTAYSENNEELMASIREEMDALSDKQTQLKKDFIKANPASYVTPTIINEISYYLEPEEMEELLGGLDPSLDKVQTVINLKDRLIKLKAVAVGQKAPDFTLNDPDGNPVSLYSLLDGSRKLLLVDFWAAWCGPCRQENPNVVKTWKEYNKKGFDVFGVSLDRTREDWLKAIEDDHLTWTHVSDLKFWDCEPAKLYAVNAIPSNFLLDGEGTIIGHNLRGDDLGKAVKEYLESK